MIGGSQVPPAPNAVESGLDAIEAGGVPGQMDLHLRKVGFDPAHANLQVAHVLSKRIHGGADIPRMLEDEIFRFDDHSNEIWPISTFGASSCRGRDMA